MRRAAAGAVLAALALGLLTGCGGKPERPEDGAGTATRTPGAAAPTGAGGTRPPDAEPSGVTPAPSARSPEAGPDPGGGLPGGGLGRWRGPVPGEPWQWQLSGRIDTSVRVPVYDLDGETTPAAVVARLHRQGSRVICYVNVGAAEDFRSDAGRFPSSVLGRPNGWPGERWLDIRRRDVLLPLMAKRFDTCRAKGFDAVEPDLVDAYQNQSGFPLRAADQLAYNRAIARLAHERGLAVGLKNDLEQVPQLVSDFDFAVNEQCFEYRECDRLLPFVRAGKAVLHVEYHVPAAAFCARTSAMGFSSMVKELDLNATRHPCRP